MVALKMIRDSALASQQQLARFRIEAEAAARMRHENIVQIEEIGAYQGRPYLVMQLVEGTRLDQYLSGKPQPPMSCAQLVGDLAHALHYAHDQKIVAHPTKAYLEAVPKAGFLVKARHGKETIYH
jgi:serine/threonine protein kinase